MAFTHNVSINFSDSGAPGAASQIVATADGQVNISVAYPDNADHFAATLQLKQAKIRSYVIWATSPCGVNTKLNGVIKDSFLLAANQMVLGGELMMSAIDLFTSDCDTVEVTATAGGTLHIHVLEDV